MIRVGLCDDDPVMLHACKNRVMELSLALEVKVLFKEFTSGEDILEHMEAEQEFFDLLILDLYMGNLSGIETAKIARERGYGGNIIFLTSSNYHAIESFAVEPIGYVLKEDLITKKFEEVFHRAVLLVQKSKQQKSIVISIGKCENLVIQLDKILYIESNLRNIRIVTEQGIQEYTYSMKKIYEKLERYGFFRCHKSFIINFRFVKCYSNHEICLGENIKVPMGRSYAEIFSRKFMKYTFSDMNTW